MKITDIAAGLKKASFWFLLAISLLGAGAAGVHAVEEKKLSFDQSQSVSNRRIRPPQPSARIDWEGEDHPPSP